MQITYSHGSGLVIAMLIGGICSPLPIAWYMVPNVFAFHVDLAENWRYWLPIVIGWLLLSQTECLPLWYLGRFLSEVSNGAEVTVIPIYLGEIASQHIDALLE